MVKSYITHVRCVTKPHSKDTTNVSFTDIFNDSLPHLYFFFTMCRDFDNGHLHIPCTHLDWEDITNFQLTVNGNMRGPVINEESMLFSYDECKDRYAIIGYEIPPTEDSQLKVLPLETRAELSVNVTSDTKQGVNLKTYHVRFFHN